MLLLTEFNFALTIYIFRRFGVEQPTVKSTDLMQSTLFNLMIMTNKSTKKSKKVKKNIQLLRLGWLVGE